MCPVCLGACDSEIIFAARGGISHAGDGGSWLDTGGRARCRRCDDGRRVKGGGSARQVRLELGRWRSGLNGGRERY